MSAAGGDVEMNTPGSAVVNTIKSGGNNFKMLDNLTYEQESFVGDNTSPELTTRGYTGQPNLKFWEGHADLGGPIKKDKVWFFGAYNHFKIDKQISGVPRTIATDLGVFDNYTTKETCKVSKNDTVVGYFQWGRKQKPLRGLSVTVAGSGAAAGQRLLGVQGRAPARVDQPPVHRRQGQPVRLRFPARRERRLQDAAAAPRHRHQLHQRRGVERVRPRRGRSRPSRRRRPTTCRREGQPRPQGRLRVPARHRQVRDRRPFGPDPLPRPERRRQRDPLRRHRPNSELGSTWRGANDRDQRYAGYAQDRWSPNSRATITAGLRWDYQRPYYLDGQRDPTVKDVLTASSGSLAGKPMFAAQTTHRPVDFHAQLDRAAPGRQLRRHRQRQHGAEGFYGRYYYNYADSFSGLNPGGANYKTFKFLDQNGNKLYDGPSELGLLTSSSGGTSTTVDPNMRKPYADEFDLSVERQFWGESSVRVAYVRKNTHNEFATINVAREGRFTVPTAVTVNTADFVNGITGRTTYNLMDIPAGISPVNVIENLPDGSYNYDTLQFAFNKRFGSGLFIQSSFDYQWRDELRGGSATNTTTISPTTSPLNSDPLPIGYFQNVNPAVSNRQQSTNWQGRAIARYVFKYDIGVATNFRAQSGYAFSRVIAASLPNAGATRFYDTNIDNNRSDMVPILDFRVDKAFKIGRYKITGMFDAFNITNSNAVTNFNLINGTSYNPVIATLDPRTLQLGVRFDF